MKQVRRGLSLLPWLGGMCTDDPTKAVHDGYTPDEIRVDRDPPWMPIDIGVRPRPELDTLIARGYVERTGPVPTLLLMTSGTLKLYEAIRLTRKGREAVVAYEHKRVTDPPAALALLAEMLDLPDHIVAALRKELSE